MFIHLLEEFIAIPIHQGQPLSIQKFNLLLSFNNEKFGARFANSLLHPFLLFHHIYKTCTMHML